MDLEKLKREFEHLRQKYNLPSFNQLNEDFDIEKLQENETDLLVREIRRAMLEKNTAYLRFIEMFLNPSNAPMFLLVLIRSVDESEKKNLNELYLELGKYELQSLALDNIYDENKEAEFVKMFAEKWQGIKKRIGKIIEYCETCFKQERTGKEKGYLG